LFVSGATNALGLGETLKQMPNAQEKFPKIKETQEENGQDRNNLDISVPLQVVQRQWPTIAACLIVSLGVALAYFVAAPSRYTATAKVMIDTRKDQFLRHDDSANEPMIDSGVVDSQVEILKSDKIALDVVRHFKLMSDPTFMEAGVLSFRAIVNLIGGVLSKNAGQSPASIEAELEQTAVEIFSDNIVVKRQLQSYVIEVDYTALTPDLAMQIANAISDLYIIGELDAAYQSTRHGTEWLDDRLKELRDQANAADHAVQAFKTTNEMVDTSRGLMSEDELSEMNGQLITARAATSEAKARLERILQIKSDSPDATVADATVADAMQNNVITRLRAQYLDLSAKEADWSSRYGARHIAVVNLRNQMAELKRSIFSELQRIAETYKSDYEIAKARESSLERSLQARVSQAGETSRAQVQLRDLESSAQSYRNLYDTFLQKFESATQQKSFPITNARVIAPAVLPHKRSSPKLLLLLGGGAVFGLAIGGGAAVIREHSNNKFRTPDDVEELSGLKYLGVLPAISPVKKNQRLPEQTCKPRDFDCTQPHLAWYAGHAPFSRFTETLRNVKVTIDTVAISRKITTIGIVSSLPNEGKTTFISNVALLFAQNGHRTLLIDGDLRKPSLTRKIMPHAIEGLAEVLSSKRTLSDVIAQAKTERNLNFLPTAGHTRIINSAELLSSSAMGRLLGQAEQVYDYIFIDFAPMLNVVDAKAAAHLIDCFILLIEWNKYSRIVVKEGIFSANLVHERLIGAVLNRADEWTLRRIENYKGRYFQSYYNKG
jgi:succinoglycan biosynthesis transport protein ExoP